MQRKPQQQALYRSVFPIRFESFWTGPSRSSPNGGPEPVSISGVAKTLLESGKDDRLDFCFSWPFADTDLASAVQYASRPRKLPNCRQSTVATAD